MFFCLFGFIRQEFLHGGKRDQEEFGIDVNNVLRKILKYLDQSVLAPQRRLHLELLILLETHHRLVSALLEAFRKLLFEKRGLLLSHVGTLIRSYSARLELGRLTFQ